MPKSVPSTPAYSPDPAGVFGAVTSIHEYTVAREKTGKLDLSEAYQGYDQFMRSAMDVSTRFEQWACKNVNFDNVVECWPYHVQHSFAKSLFSIVKVTELEKVDDDVFKQVAKVMELPLVGAPEVADNGKALSADHLTKKLSRAQKRRRAPSIEHE